MKRFEKSILPAASPITGIRTSLDQRRHDLAERCPDNHADRQVQHVPPHDELLEFRKHVDLLFRSV